MKSSAAVIRYLAPILLFATAPSLASAASTTAPDDYHIYAGNTHAHTAFTWSHGDQWMPTPKRRSRRARTRHLRHGRRSQSPPKRKCSSRTGRNIRARRRSISRWRRQSGYDFYVTTDHSQEADFQPPSPNNANWIATKQAGGRGDRRASSSPSPATSIPKTTAPAATDISTSSTAPSTSTPWRPASICPYLYKWLKTAKPNGDGPVVASFNHPGPHQYNDWAYRDAEVTDIITMLEVINSNNKHSLRGVRRRARQGLEGLAGLRQRQPRLLGHHAPHLAHVRPRDRAGRRPRSSTR